MPVQQSNDYITLAFLFKIKVKRLWLAEHQWTPVLFKKAYAEINILQIMPEIYESSFNLVQGLLIQAHDK